MRLAFVGDLALGDHPKTVGFGFRSRYPVGIPAEMLLRLRPPGPRPDLLFGNLEFALGFAADTSADLARLQCRGLDSYADALARAGVTALNVANNHSSQAGSGPFHATIECLRAARIHVVGTPADFAEAGTLRLGDARVALLGWSDRPRQYSVETPPYNEFSDDAYEQVTRARERADVVIASMHWGDEFILVPGDREREIARRLVDAGASCVIGHHPHVLRAVERYNGALIAYSLGNFVGDMTWDRRTRLTGWLTVEVAGAEVGAATLTPAMIDDDYFPRPLSEPSTHRLWNEWAVAQAAQARRVSRLGYRHVAEAERRRHARRTAWMMLRHVHRYAKGTMLAVFRGAISHRVRAVVSRIKSA